MKFAKQLEAQTIEEWKYKYIQYKQLKKIIKKAIAISEDHELHDAQTDNDMRFTAALDSEIQKVQDFYFGRLNNASKQKEAIEQQLKEWDLEFTAVNTLNCESADNPPIPIASDLERGNMTSDDEYHNEPSKTDDTDVNHHHEIKSTDIDGVKNSSERPTLLPPSLSLSKPSGFFYHHSASNPQQQQQQQQQRSNNSINISSLFTLPYSLQKRDSSFTLSTGSQSHSLMLTSPLTHHSKHAAEQQHHHSIATLTFAKFSSLAKLRIKKALIELFHSLELLRSFRQLNILAYTKIVKKFEKKTRRNIGVQLMEELRGSHFHNSIELDTLLIAVEDLFKQYFAKDDKDPKKALQILRSTTQWDQPIASRLAIDVEYATVLVHENDVSFVSGLLTGVNVMLIAYIWSILAATGSGSNNHSSSSNNNNFVITNYNYEENLMQRNVIALIYFSFGLPLLLANLLCISMHVWDDYKINYRLIFGLMKKLHWAEYAIMISCFTFAYLLTTALSLNGSMNRFIPMQFQPWIVLSVMVAMFVVPSKGIFFDDSRFWLGKVMLRIIVTPYYPCRFRDFFIADLLVSITPCFQAVLLLYTISIHGIDAVVAENSNSTLTIPSFWFLVLMNVLPSYSRCIQCLRRFYDANGGTLLVYPSNAKNWMQLVNAYRYFTSIAAVVLFALPKLYPNTAVPPQWLLYIAVGVRLFYSILSVLWDVIMDFGFGQMRMFSAFHKHRQQFTDEFDVDLIIYPLTWYIGIIILDFIGRFAWLFFAGYLLAETTLDFHYSFFVLSLIETVRRFLWTFFRVEIEHIANCRTGRVSAEVELPFAVHDLYI